MKTKAIAIDIARSVKVPQLIWTLGGVCAVLFVLYVYLMNSTVFHVAKRVELERQMTDIRTSLSTTEFEYIDAVNKIDLELAYALGFQESEAATFTSASKATTLSLNTTE